MIQLPVVEFSIQHHYFKGEKLIRAGASTEHWDLRFDFGKSESGLKHFVLESNPLDYSSTTAYEKQCAQKSWLLKGLKGPEFLPPGTAGNPTKATPAWVELIDSGKANVLEWSDQFIKVQFEGKKLKGLWTIQREGPQEPIWTFGRSEMPQVVQQELQVPLQFRRLGSALLVTGIALKPGTYRGLDGNTISYSASVIAADFPDMVGKPIKISHDDQFQTVKGFVRAAAVKDGNGVFEGIIWDPQTIEDFESGKRNGFSVELNTQCYWDPDKKVYNARSFISKAITAIPLHTAACKECCVISTAPVALTETEVVDEPEWADPHEESQGQSIDVRFQHKTEERKMNDEEIEALLKEYPSLPEPIKACVKAGHTMDECFKLAKIFQYPANAHPTKMAEGLTEDEIDNLLALYPDLAACIKAGHSAAECKKIFEKYGKPAAADKYPKQEEFDKVKTDLAESLKANEALKTSHDGAVKLLTELQTKELNAALEQMKKMLPDFVLPATLTTHDQKMNYLNIVMTELAKVVEKRATLQVGNADPATAKDEASKKLFGASLKDMTGEK